MDLNHIELPGFVVANLYHSSLIETDETSAKVQPVSVILEKDLPAGPDSYREKWLGENRKNILIIVHYREELHLPDTEFAFLTRMLSACKLNIGDVAILNLNTHPTASYTELVTHFKSKIVFLFGVEPATFGLPMNFPHFQLQPFASCTFLFTPTLKELEDDKVLGSKLWVCLRRLFGI